MSRDVYAANEAQTCALARQLASKITAPATLCLDGALGAGKSVFARAFLQALGVDGEIPSPTFTLVQTYHAQGQEIWHMDAYRIEDAQEAQELGILDAFEQAICVIEWPGKIADILPENRLDIFIERPSADVGARHITLEGSLLSQIAL
jgi:tRNA threonylcarbamoyladenosine biosynthesis protein TsaE